MAQPRDIGCLLIHGFTSSPAEMEGLQRDQVVPFAKLQFVAERVQSTHLETMVVAESYHVLTVDRDREQIFQRIQAFIQKVT